MEGRLREGWQAGERPQRLEPRFICGLLWHRLKSVPFPKAGVIELTRSMALELAPKVRVCAVAPGYVLTPMQRAEYSDAMLEEVNQKIPLRRHAKPEEIAGLFAYLASDDATFATGHVFIMDGGETAGGLASR